MITHLKVHAVFNPRGLRSVEKISLSKPFPIIEDFSVRKARNWDMVILHLKGMTKNYLFNE